MLLEIVEMLFERGMRTWASVIAACNVIIPSLRLNGKGPRRFVMYLLLLLMGMVIRWLCDRLLHRQTQRPHHLVPQHAHESASHQPKDGTQSAGNVHMAICEKQPSHPAASPQSASDDALTPQRVMQNSPIRWDSIVTPHVSSVWKSRKLEAEDDEPSPQARPMDEAFPAVDTSVEETCGATSGARSSPSRTSPTHEDEEMLAASMSYNEQYRELMMLMQKPALSERPKAFLGFSLEEDGHHRELVVDGVYQDGPAYQVGVRIEDALTHISGCRVSSVEQARKAVAQNCRPGELSALTFLRPSGTSYTVKLWVMTAEPRYRGKPYFFDTESHVKDQRPNAVKSRRRSMGR